MKIIVFDTETAGCKTQTLANVGYKVVDLNLVNLTYKTLVSRDYLVRSVYKNKIWLVNDMFVGTDKLSKFDNNVEKGGTILRTIPQIFKTLENDLRKYEVEAGYAYNCDFDTDKFERTAVEYGLPNPLETIPIFDLWGYAYWNICVTDAYRQFCADNNLVTKSGRFIPTSVEGVTKFLNQDVEFIEDHTALSDVNWELRILIECISRGQNPFELIRRGKWIPTDPTAPIDDTFEE